MQEKVMLNQNYMEVLHLNISSQQYETYAGSSFKELYGERDLCDVTLVCSDDHQLKAHNVRRISSKQTLDSS